MIKLSEDHLYDLRDAIRAIGFNADVVFNTAGVSGIIAWSRNRYQEKRYLQLWEDATDTNGANLDTDFTDLIGEVTLKSLLQ